MKILVGCDPELFVTVEGKPRSAHGLIPGDKKNPHPIKDGAVQVDGMALEFNINPAASEDEFVNNISSVMQQLREMVPNNYSFLLEPSVRFNGNHMNAQPKEAKELGCEPDFSAYTLKENPKPNGNTTLRTASGHVHIGVTEGQDPKDEAHFVRMATLVKHLDLFLGIKSLEWDTDHIRRQLYGQAGAMRVKPYGVEYRVLSNRWLDKEETVRLVYKQVIACINDLRTNGALEEKDYNLIRSRITMGGIKVWDKLSEKAKKACLAANIKDAQKIAAYTFPEKRQWVAYAA